jgi:hypothetical protein
MKVFCVVEWCWNSTLRSTFCCSHSLKKEKSDTGKLTSLGIQDRRFSAMFSGWRTFRKAWRCYTTRYDVRKEIGTGIAEGLQRLGYGLDFREILFLFTAELGYLLLLLANTGSAAHQGYTVTSFPSDKAARSYPWPRTFIECSSWE